MSSLDNPDISVARDISLAPEAEAILRSMFEDFSRVVVEAEFGRGFSGSRAFRVRLVEKEGRARLPAVVKIAPRGLIEKEQKAYEALVAPTLPHIARLEAPPTLSPDGKWGGLHYALVGGGTFEIESLYDYYYEADADDICWLLENRLFRILGSNWWLDNRTDRTFQMQADYDDWLPVNLMISLSPCHPALTDCIHLVEPSTQSPSSSIAIGDQVEVKGFVVTKVDFKKGEVTLNIPQPQKEQRPASYHVRLTDVPDINRYHFGEVIDSIGGTVVATRHDVLVGLATQAMWQAIDPEEERLTVSGELTLPNPLLTYQAVLQDFLTVNASPVHGDLNLENVLVDPDTRDVSLIDFATVRHGHTLHDLLRLEVEVMIMLIPPILEEARLPPETIYFLHEQLHRATIYPEQVTSLSLPTTALEKPFRVLFVIRKMARNCLFNPDDWGEYYRGLILYLLGVLKFGVLHHGKPATQLARQVAFWGAATAQHFVDLPQSQVKQPGKKRAPVREAERLFEIEPPFGTMRPDSRFYIEREADDLCQQQITGPYAVTLFVQAPMQTGKSSLVRRALHQARKEHNTKVAFIDFQKFTEQYFREEEKFFVELCMMIGDAFGVPEAINQYWQGQRTSIINCSRYVSDHIIPSLKGSFILAMDEVERMVTCPFRSNFFGMLRTWHNDRVYDESFARMTLLISSSTDSYLLIDNTDQSPFNVATRVPLGDFSVDEVRELNRRHNSPLTQAQVDDLMDLVKGHPFLTRVALYQLALDKIDMATLLSQAIEDNGPFGDHLRHYLRRILQQPELKQALVRICQQHTWEEKPAYNRLKEAGLIRKTGKEVVPRNKLYERYFEERLNG